MDTTVDITIAYLQLRCNYDCVASRLASAAGSQL